MKNLLAVILYLITFSAYADSINFMFGRYNSISRTSISYTSESVYSLGKLNVTPEFGLVQFRDRQSKELNQVYFTPVINYPVGNLIFDGGIGVSLMNSHRIDGKELSTYFQFTDHLGVRYEFYKNYAIGYRITHISNAGIKRPNPGIDSQQIYFSIPYQNKMLRLTLLYRTL